MLRNEIRKNANKTLCVDYLIKLLCLKWVEEIGHDDVYDNYTGDDDDDDDDD